MPKQPRKVTAKDFHRRRCRVGITQGGQLVCRFAQPFVFGGIGLPEILLQQPEHGPNLLHVFSGLMDGNAPISISVSNRVERLLEFARDDA